MDNVGKTPSHIYLSNDPNRILFHSSFQEELDDNQHNDFYRNRSILQDDIDSRLVDDNNLTQNHMSSPEDSSYSHHRSQYSQSQEIQTAGSSLSLRNQNQSMR